MNEPPIPPLRLGRSLLGPGQPCYVIAEAGVNHNGDLDLARKLVDAAADAGADAVKFQTFQADRLVTAGAARAEYQKRNTGEDTPQIEMLRRLELDRDAHLAILERCRARDIQFLSTPFAAPSADLLEDLGVPAFKVSSGDLTNLPFLAHLARKGRPVLLSTGMGTLGEVEAALAAMTAEGLDQVALLHCVSSYPTEPADANLRAMATLARSFRVPTGYSDHTTGLEVSLAAVALGACVLEKHFTLDRSLPGPDQVASLEPDELAALVRGVRRVEAALGDGRKRPAPCERNTAEVARKSLVAALDLAAGTVLGPGHLEIRCPGTGLAPALLPHVLGRTLRRAVPRDTPLALEDLA
jgi:N-acetylneuraminate synthase